MVADLLSPIYSKGVMPAASESSSDAGGVIYVQKARRAVKVPVSEVYTVDSARKLLKDALEEACKNCNVDSLYSASGMGDLIAADLMFDQQTTDLVHEENYEHISTTQGVVRSGMVIVSSGEIVTAEIEQLLDSYKAEYDANVGYVGPKLLQWVGNCLISFFLVLLLLILLQ